MSFFTIRTPKLIDVKKTQNIKYHLDTISKDLWQFRGIGLIWILSGDASGTIAMDDACDS